MPGDRVVAVDRSGGDRGSQAIHRRGHRTDAAAQAVQVDLEGELCRRVASSQAEPEFAPARLGEAQRSAIDPALAAVELGWRPETSLEDGLRTTWASFTDAAD